MFHAWKHDTIFAIEDLREMSSRQKMKKNAILNSIEIISFKNLLENLPNGPIMNFSTISRSLEKKKK